MPRAVKKGYESVLSDVVFLIKQARRVSVRVVNSIMTAAYWEMGRRIVELEQKSRRRAHYGSHLLEKLSVDMTQKLGRGFGVDNLQRFRVFYQLYSTRASRIQISEKNVGTQIYATPLRKSLHHFLENK